ncbi:MAG TPA: YoaK family protein [Terracidiphilus sp.]|nr:YoaK family protein [Terracidiphilus sp.]
MPVVYLRRLTSASRTDSANRHLARYLAFIAGAANAGGFLAVHQYTSHMSGVVSSAADNLAVGDVWLVVDGLVAVFAFFMGSYLSTVLIRWGKERGLISRYALPLLSEAALLAVFGFTGREFTGQRVLGTVVLLCFTMGLQNAMITKISDSVIRTTHMTGIVTDIGIAVGKLSFASTHQDIQSAEVMAALRLLLSLLGLFFVGGVIGAVGFKHVGFLFTLPLASILFVLAIIPVIDDLRGKEMPANA